MAKTLTITQSSTTKSFTLTPGVGPAGPNHISTSTGTDISGILKGDGSNVAAAVEDTDYQGVLAEGAFADGDKTKLDGIESGADVTDATNVDAAGAVMESDYTPAHSLLVQQSGTGAPSSVTLSDNSILGRSTGSGSSITGLSATQVRTLLNVEDGADVTDTANVTAAGALMDSEVANLADVKAFDPADYATAAQGALADTALQDITGESLGDLQNVTQTGTGPLLYYDGTVWRDRSLAAAGVAAASHTHDVEDLDFAGSTDIGAALADADEVLVSDGGGNTTRRKSALSRFWTYIKSKIDGNITIAGTKDFSDQVELTGQAATTDDSAVTVGIAKRNYINPMKTLRYDMEGTYNTGTVLGGSITNRPHYIQLECADGSNSGAQYFHPATNREVAGTDLDNGNFAGVDFSSQINANILLRSRLGNPSTDFDWIWLIGRTEPAATSISSMVVTGTASNRGWVGLECIGGSVKIIAVNGTSAVSRSAEIDNWGTSTYGQGYRLEISGGAASCYDADGALLGTLASGCPTTFKANGTSPFFLVEAQGGATTNQLGIIVQHISLDW